jgi:hypothetical protein
VFGSKEYIVLDSLTPLEVKIWEKYDLYTI